MRERNDPSVITEIREIKPFIVMITWIKLQSIQIFINTKRPGEPTLYSKPYRFDANQNKFDMDKKFRLI